MKHTYTLESALARLARNGIRPNGTDFVLSRPPGLKLLGALDYLRTKHDFTVRIA